MIQKEVRQMRMAPHAPRKVEEDYAYEDEQGEHRNYRLVLEIMETAVLTLLLFLAVRVAVQNYQVQGPSMTPTLLNTQYILVDKVDYYLHAPQRGDVIVFVAPPNPSEDYVKRIIGLPGDTVRIDVNGNVYVDGVHIDEPYVNDLTNPYGPHTWIVAPNDYFVLGDNRGDSSDSRAWGFVPRQNNVGKAMMVYWPAPNLHFIPSWSNEFVGVH